MNNLRLVHAEQLQRVVMSDDWPYVVKQIEQLKEEVDERLLNASPEDDLVYLKGKVDGAKQLLGAIQDLRNWIRAREDKY